MKIILTLVSIMVASGTYAENNLTPALIKYSLPKSMALTEKQLYNWYHEDHSSDTIP